MRMLCGKPKLLYDSLFLIYFITLRQPGQQWVKFSVYYYSRYFWHFWILLILKITIYPFQIHRNLQHQNSKYSPGWYGSVDWALAWEPTGCWSDSQSRAHAWVVGQVTSRQRARGNHTLMFLSLSFSFPSPLSKIKLIKSLKYFRYIWHKQLEMSCKELKKYFPVGISVGS